MAFTPVKGKRALPLSTSLFFSEQPSRQSDLQVALDHVKFQYWKGQWRECVATCQRLLSDLQLPSLSLHTVYLHFYHAVCLDCIGRGMHDLSSGRICVLEHSLESYKAAAAALPRPEKPLEDPETVTTPTKYYSNVTSALQTPTKDVHNQHSDLFSPASPMPQKRFTRKSIGALIPSPLHIHRDASILNSPATPPRNQTMTVKAPPFTPPRNIVPSTPPTSVRHPSVTFSASSYTWLRQRSNERYNLILVDFKNMLQGHITAVEIFLSEIKDIKANKSVRGIVSFGEDKEARAVDLRLRILRLKARGWRRERFEPARYESLCAMALAEI